METGITVGFNRIVRDLSITTVEKQGCQQTSHFLKLETRNCKLRGSLWRQVVFLRFERSQSLIGNLPFLQDLKNY